MEQLTQRVKQALEQRFVGANAEGVTWEPSTERIGGLLLWEGFAGLEHRERQKRVWNFLRQDFDAEAAHVSLIFAYTPHEYEVMQAA